MTNSTENQYLHKSPTKSVSSSSDEDNNIDNEEESKTDSIIPDDEKFFIHTDMETNENIQPNNMMDIFRRQSSIINETNNNFNDDHSLEKNESHIPQEPISSSTPERNTNTQVFSDENQTRKALTFSEQDEQQNGEINSDDDDDLALQDNFSFLIAKGMLKRS